MERAIIKTRINKTIFTVTTLDVNSGIHNISIFKYYGTVTQVNLKAD